MHDALFVRGFERIGDLARDGERFITRDRPPQQPIGERGAFDQFEHEDRHPARVFQPVDGADVRMIQRGEQLRFATEPRDTIGVLRKRVREDLERDVASQCGIAGPIHFAHSPGADRCQDFVRAEAHARCDAHERADGL